MYFTARDQWIFPLPSPGGGLQLLHAIRQQRSINPSRSPSWEHEALAHQPLCVRPLLLGMAQALLGLWKTSRNENP